MKRKKALKPRKNFKQIKTYGFCIGGLTFLVVVALLLPQIIFGVLDKYRMSNTEVESRSNMNISQVNATYEKQMYDRMGHFSSMSRDIMNVAAIHYELKDVEEGELLESIFSQDWIYMLNYVTAGIYQIALNEAFIEVNDCKKYVVYGTDYQEGVTLMMWYLDLSMEEVGARVRFLVDTETGSIYYIKITSIDETMNTEYKNIAQSETVEYMTLATFFIEGLNDCKEYYKTYYESDIDNQILYDEDIYTYYYVCDEWSHTVGGEGDNYLCYSEYPLMYGEISMELIFSATAGQGANPDIEFGISSIGSIIPEMMQK